MNLMTQIFSRCFRRKSNKSERTYEQAYDIWYYGPADFFLCLKRMKNAIITKLVRKNNLPLFILGGGANLLIRG